MEKTPITIEDIIIGIETDHGARQVYHTYSTEDTEGVCALGNLALDIIKRTGKKRTSLNIQRIGVKINDRLKQFAGGGPHVIQMNDSAHMGFENIGKRVRMWAMTAGYPLDKPIAYLEDL